MIQLGLLPAQWQLIELSISSFVLFDPKSTDARKRGPMLITTGRLDRPGENDFRSFLLKKANRRRRPDFGEITARQEAGGASVVI